MISSSPNQKEGIDTPIREVAVARLSKMEYCLVAAMTPQVTPMTIERGAPQHRQQGGVGEAFEDLGHDGAAGEIGLAEIEPGQDTAGVAHVLDDEGVVAPPAWR